MDTFKSVIDLNLNSVMASCTFFHENLIKNNGSIVIIGEQILLFIGRMTNWLQLVNHVCYLLANIQILG